MKVCRVCGFVILHDNKCEQKKENKMKKLIFVVIGLFLFTSLGYCANVTDDAKGTKGEILVNNGSKNGHIGTWTDSSFLKGDKGDLGNTGQKGKDGQKGEKGDIGKGLQDRQEAQIELRVLDTKNTTTSLYYIRDFNNQNNTTGIKITIKLGKSYELRKIEDLEKKIELLTKGD